MNERAREVQLRRILTEFAAAAVPNDMNIWPSVSLRLQTRERGSPWHRLVPTTRLELAGLGLALFLTLGVAGYAVGSTLGERLFISAAERWGQSVKADQITELGQAQTINGVTITLQRAYILGDQIGIEYTVSSMPAPYVDESGNYHDFGPSQLGTLTNDAGTAFSADTSAGFTAPSSGLFIPVFERPVVHESSENLRLRFTVSVAEFLSEASGPGNTEVGQDENLDESRVLAYRETGVEPYAGPFTFEFTIPVVSTLQGSERR